MTTEQHPSEFPEQAQQFARRCGDRLPGRVYTVILTGSFARGDQRPDSDIDLIVLVDHADKELLQAVSGIVTSIPTTNELNPAVIATSELLRDPDIFDWLPIKHDGAVLLGELPEVPPSRLSELGLAKQIAQTVLMSSRHYLAVAEPAENFSGGKLWLWNLKPLAFALRFYEYHLSGHYIRPLPELAAKYPVLSRDPATEHATILDECIEICERILRT